ncbi:hypothetical protein BSZ07_36130 [Streptomyces sp. M1013]|nr:hypothetical protein BSZ07_36130 [Streptomyces sp. M1013]
MLVSRKAPRPHGTRQQLSTFQQIGLRYVCAPPTGYLGVFRESQKVSLLTVCATGEHLGPDAGVEVDHSW